MIKAKKRRKHLILSMWIIACGLLYIFAYQFRLPSQADVFLYGMLAGLVAMTLLERRIVVNAHFVLFVIVDISALIGVLYTTMVSEGIREAVLFVFFAVLVFLSSTNPDLIKLFTKWVYIVSILVVVSSILHFILPEQFNSLMAQVLREDAFEQFMWSYNVDNTFAGISAYTSNTTFSSAIVFGNSFLNLVNKKERPIIKNKIINIVLLALSFFSIIICSKRGIFVATLVAMVIMMFFLYRKRRFILKFSLVAIIFIVIFVILYENSVFVSSFFNRFVSGDFMSGRDVIYETLLTDFRSGNIFIGNGTASTYALAAKGAHNIYLQILYDHGIVFSIPYYVFLIYNYIIAIKNKCPLSIFVQTLFLVYGISGNPLYSNMFMIIYLYHVLYATKMPYYEKQK